MVTEADWHSWTPEQMRPYFDTVMEAFGASRLMFGSDWPVLTVASTYEQWLDVVKQAIHPLTDSEAAAIMYGTATRIYELGPAESTTSSRPRDALNEAGSH
jgi:L-fuconolactonase